jgi:pyruvate/2-oxoglutarate dehydrogenase complex dihydrolipoamide dehydrogenase (E3) component
MDTFDFVIIGAGPAGEAAAYEARRRGASAAVIDREWFGGSCPHIGCVPSKALLYAAYRHAAGDDYSWQRASARRDYMVNRAADAPAPDDTSHVKGLQAEGAVTYRGTARIVERSHVEIAHDGVTHVIQGTNVVIAIGSHSKRPPIPGLAEIDVWTNRQATLARELPKSLLVLGGGPTGCELAQVYARFGVPTTIVQSGDRLMPTDHPRNSDAVAQTLRNDGVDVRLNVRAQKARAGQGKDGAHVIDLSDGAIAEGHAILLAVGREFELDELGLEHYGIDLSGRVAVPRDGRLRIATGLWMIGDPAGPELHTHQAHYQGEMAVAMALGDDVHPDYRALPRATYTDPEAAFVGLSLEQARADGYDAFEVVADFPRTAKGYSVEATIGHVTVVVDRKSRTVVGVAIAAPDASAAIHEGVLAIKARVTIDVLADTIHAFPSTSRIFNGLFNEAARKLADEQRARSEPGKKEQAAEAVGRSN